MRDNKNNRPLEADSTLIRLLEANGTKFLKNINQGEIRKRFGHNLPHWTFDGAVYHVRFRLFDSIPAKIRQELIEEKTKLLTQIRSPVNGFTALEKRRLMFLYTEKVERVLDQGYGQCWLRKKPVGDLITNALKYFERERYILYAWCIMPNHVHAVVQPLSGFKLPGIIHSWKSYTANQANKILSRKGKFWQREYFDHIIRDASGFVGSVDYVYTNPEKAGLDGWEWRYKFDFK